MAALHSFSLAPCGPSPRRSGFGRAGGGGLGGGSAARHANECCHSSALDDAPAFRRSTRGSYCGFDPASSASGQVSRDRRRMLFRNRNPGAAAAPRAPALVPGDMMPEAAPARPAKPRGSTAPAPHYGSHPECVPDMSGLTWRNSNRDIMSIKKGHNKRIFCMCALLFPLVPATRLRSPGELRRV